MAAGQLSANKPFRPLGEDNDTCINLILAFMVTMIIYEGACDQDILTLRREEVIYVSFKITRIPSAPRRS